MQLPEGWKEVLLTEMDRRFRVSQEKGKWHDDALAIDDTQIGVEFAIDFISSLVAAAPTPPAQESDCHGEDLTKFYIVRKPGIVPRVCRPMGDDLAANLRDWFKHHPGATIDIVRVRLIDGRVSDLWVDDGIEYLQILDDGGWIPERPDASTPPAQEDEPVAWMYKSDRRQCVSMCDGIAAEDEVKIPLYTRPQS